MDAAFTLQGLLLSEMAAFSAGALGTLVFANVRHRRGTRSEQQSDADAAFAGWLDQTPDAILCFDAALGCVFASSATARMFGLAASEFIGRDPRSLTNEDTAPIESAVARAKNGEVGAEAVFRAVRPTGGPFWIEARLSAADDEGRIVAVLRDVSTRKTAELALRIANQELNKLAGSDGLTGLANRRRFDQALESECRRASRHTHPVSLLLLDVDRFKPFNDRYGHQAGDACLKKIGAALQSAASRTTDLAARFGGEEFALMLPDTDEASAAAIAERVRGSVAGLDIPHEGNREAGGIVTVSVGCSTAHPTSDSLRGQGAALIAGADRALYEAKRLGRNRVVAPVPTQDAEPLRSRLIGDPARLARLAAIRSAGGFAPSPNLDRIARMAAVLLGMPIAFVALLDRDETVVIGRHGLDGPPPTPPRAMCAHLLGTCGALVVPDVHTRPPMRDFAVRHGIAFLAAVPLLSGDDLQHVGGLWVVDRQARSDLDEPKRSLLSRLAGLVVEDLESRSPPFPIHAEVA